MFINIENIIVQGHMKFRSFFLKVLGLAIFLMFRSSLLHSDIAERKCDFFSKNLSYFYWRDIIAKPGIVNPV